MATILTGTTVMAPNIEVDVFVYIVILCGDYQYGGYVITDLQKAFSQFENIVDLQKYGIKSLQMTEQFHKCTLWNHALVR